MTKKELSQLFYINLEIKDIKEKIEEIESRYIGAINYSNDRVQTGRISDSTRDIAIKVAELTELYEVKLKELFIQRARIERFIDGIEDSDIRLIVRLRHINCMTWEQIGQEMNYHYSTIIKKYQNHFSQNSHR